MKVLHFYRTYRSESFGGIEQFINQLCRGTPRQGITSDVLTLSRQKPGGTINWEGHTVYRAPLDFEIASTGFSLEALRLLPRLVRNYDLVHYHFPWPFMDVAHFLGRIDKPSVVTYHSDIVRQKLLYLFYRPLMRRFLGSVDRIVAGSPNYLTSSPVLQSFAGKTTVIPYGLDRTSYPAPSPETLGKWRARFGARFFFFVGVLRYYKGLHILLDALQGTSFPVVIAGSGPEEAALKEGALRLGLQHVHFLGSLPDEDKAALFHLCTGMVFPSCLRSEAFGISLLEGAMYGKPLICCEIGTGTTFINVHGETGLAVPPFDPAALREAMRRIWDNPAMADAMGRAARERFEKLFTAGRMVADYARLYEETLARHSRREVRS